SKLARASWIDPALIGPVLHGMAMRAHTNAQRRNVEMKMTEGMAERRQCLFPLKAQLALFQCLGQFRFTVQLRRAPETAPQAAGWTLFQQDAAIVVFQQQ